ncbi:MAG: glutaryl-7-ACA acylase [Saprospiraceae bacterium]|nr:MAG: glutaryl-7-ACA acylase [Saprospiraceae bacterium]
MKNILPLFFLFLPFLLVAQDFAQDSAWIVDNYDKIEQYIPMRDGVKLFTAIYVPKDKTEKHPIMLTRTPYSCAPYGKDEYNNRLWNRQDRYYMRKNYIRVFQDVRGRWMSEGDFVDVRPFNPNKKDKDTDEASDTYDAIEWLINNLPDNNGRVGVKGTSYPGFYATMAALSGHPALVAVSPQAPVTDWFIGDDFHHNGAFFQMDGFSFYSSFGKPRPEPTTVGPERFQFPTPDNYQFYLEDVGVVKNFNAKYLGDSIAFWKDIMAHPNYDDFWQARNPRNFVTDVKPAMMVVGGLFDAEDCFGAWRMYEAIEEKSPNANNRLVMGPWYHGQWSSQDGSYLGHIQFGGNTAFWYQNEIEIPFFNYHLLGEGDISNLAEATVFFTGENKWHVYNQWPPKGQVDQTIYFQPGGGLNWSKPTQKESFTEYISDPENPVPYTDGVHLRRTREYMLDDQRFASRRPDVLVFQTDILQEDLTLAGTVIADLLVSISGTDADFVVKVIDVFPDDFAYENPKDDYPMGGYQMLVRGEIMRGRFRNSFENPTAFAPNKVERVKFELPDVAHTFHKGHRLMIQVQSSWFPLVDRNPHKFINIYEANESDFQKATIKVHHDQKNSSGIILPVLK